MLLSTCWAFDITKNYIQVLLDTFPRIKKLEIWVHQPEQPLCRRMMIEAELYKSAIEFRVDHYCFRYTDRALLPGRIADPKIMEAYHRGLIPMY